MVADPYYGSNSPECNSLTEVLITYRNFYLNDSGDYRRQQVNAQASLLLNLDIDSDESIKEFVCGLIGKL